MQQRHTRCLFLQPRSPSLQRDSCCAIPRDSVRAVHNEEEDRLQEEEEDFYMLLLYNIVLYT